MSDEHTLLNSSEREKFHNLEQMFDSPGWAILTRDMRAEVEDLPIRAFFDAPDFEALQAARAKHTALTEVLAYPDFIALEKENLMIEKRQALEDEAMDDTDV